MPIGIRSGEPILALMGHHSMHAGVLEKFEHEGILQRIGTIRMLMQEMPATTKLFKLHLRHEMEMNPPFFQNGIDLILGHSMEFEGVQSGTCCAWRRP